MCILSLVYYSMLCVLGLVDAIVVVSTVRGSFFLRAHLLSFRCNMGKIRREIVCTKVWLKKVKRNLKNCKKEIKKSIVYCTYTNSVCNRVYVVQVISSAQRVKRDRVVLIKRESE